MWEVLKGITAGDVGNARVKDCLEEHREDPTFNAECKGELEKMMEHRATDFRLDSNLRELCADDIETLCGLERVRSCLQRACLSFTCWVGYFAISHECFHDLIWHLRYEVRRISLW